MKTNKLRKLFLDYFKAKNHKVFPSSSLVPAQDPTLLFTGAGMNQFKPYFLGDRKGLERAASCQKCIRTADLDRVGETPYHHTFFEMLGNFSFGDYFKEEAIQYGWEFVTKELKIPREDLWASVFEDDREGFEIWRKKIGLPEARIKRFSAADNFWPANAPTEGPNGPCGPCSEIYYGRVPGEGVEIWNLVFTEYDRQEGGFLKPLPQKNIDTGMGLERLAAVLQAKASNFDIDVFLEIKNGLARLVGDLVLKHPNLKARNAALDHIRAITMAISDEVLPSNEGRGYVIRKLIRKTVMHLRELGVAEPVLYRWVKAVARTMKEPYPEVLNRVDAVSAIVRREEEAFGYILDTRAREAEIKVKTIALSSTRLDTRSSERATELAFEFYDTYGVPKEILQKIIEDNHLVFEEELFLKRLDEQRGRSRLQSKISGRIFTMAEKPLFAEKPQRTRFLGYETLKSRARIVGAVFQEREVDRLEKGQQGILVLDQTPFYGEGGGQVGDQGKITGPESRCHVGDTQWYDDLIFHSVRVEEGSLKKFDEVETEVDRDYREKVIKNHSATHLLHSALREILGPHVKQSGSLVAPDRLRFDFTHFEPLKKPVLRKVERLVNAEIQKRNEVQTVLKDTRKAIEEGALAFFGEKYDSEVRVVSMGAFSTELCGGTHVLNTGDIRLFRIVSETSVQAGVRRIEAVTGEAAYRMEEEAEAEILALTRYLSCSRAELAKTVQDSHETTRGFQKRVKAAFMKHLQREIRRRTEEAQTLKGTKVVVAGVEGLDPGLLREAADWARSQGGSYAVAMASTFRKKPQVVVALSRDLVKRNLHASDFIKEITRRMDGAGGGRSDLAVGGGKERTDLGEVLRFAREEIEKALREK